MDKNIRLVLLAVLCFIGLHLYQAWQQDYPPLPFPEVAAPQNTPESLGPPVLVPDQPSVSAQATVPASPPGISNAKFVNVVTDLFDIAISLHGGSIEKAALLQYPQSVRPGAAPFVVLDAQADMRFRLQAGLLAEDSAPDHVADYTSSLSNYVMSSDADSIDVVLHWRGEEGLAVDKVYRFQRGSYVIEVYFRVRNDTDSPWQGRFYQQAERRNDSSRGFVYSFKGVVLSSPEDRYQKYDFDDLQDQNLDVEFTDGWVGLSQHYFVVAIIPDRTISSRYYSRIIDTDSYLVGTVGAPLSVSPRQSAETMARLYIGPKLQETLPAVADGLDLTVDYGVFWVISKPLFILIKAIHDMVGNWGWAIVLVTILLKVLFFPLQDKAYRSMARMRKLQPRMVAIKERYGDDRQRMQMAMMELYRTEKLNPLGGCLPIAVQIPVFIALYWVLLESVEMRQAPFVLWLNDLSGPDRFYVLPLLMGVTMFFQQKLNPAPMDPVQARVMQILPFVFTVFYAFLPSGLVLYWVVQSVLSIGQQWLITRRIDAAPS